MQGSPTPATQRGPSATPPPRPRLSDFLTLHAAEILLAWDEFAATVSHDGKTLDAKALRDHAAETPERRTFRRWLVVVGKRVEVALNGGRSTQQIDEPALTRGERQPIGRVDRAEA